MANLPDEIISEILSRLPVVSLCRFRCVSKPWRSLISLPDFIRTHLTNNKHEHVILGHHGSLYSVHLESSQFGHESEQEHLKLPTEQDLRLTEIYGSCDGLLLIGLWRAYDECVDHCHYLVNPSTREFKKLPPFPFGFEPWRSLNLYGFGYDSRSDDFKVVSIAHHEERAENEVSVYELRTDTWKTIENSPFLGRSDIGDQSGVLVSGALHWFTSNFILALDLAIEKFRTIPTLDCMGDELVVLGRCLCVSGERNDEDHADFWVMKEYGVGESWTKFTITCDMVGYWKPWSSSRADRVLFQVNNRTLVLFDPQEEKSKELVVHGLPTDFVAGTYVESLVSPNRQC